MKKVVLIAWNFPKIAKTSSFSPDLYLYDSVQKKICNTKLNNSDNATIYVCGITPYDATHIGHAATYIAFDLINRQWRDKNLQVTYTQNVTDVDDPLLERAKSLGQDWQNIALEQTQLFRKDMEALRIIPPEHYISVVEAIPLIIKFIQKLQNLKLSYTIKNVKNFGYDTYFSIDAAKENFPSTLGKISHLDKQTMLKVFEKRGGDPKRLNKKNPLDPLLWVAQKENEPSWDGKILGKGRPGWHIECAAIAEQFLPQPFTIQGGGSDLTFPHHEMCAMHVESLSKKPMANFYVHAGMVGLDGQKMSKSVGNLVFVSKLREKNIDPQIIRLTILLHHYRSNWFWFDGLLEKATKHLVLWKKAVSQIGLAYDPETMQTIQNIRLALSNDLDTPKTIDILDGWAEKVLLYKNFSTETMAESDTVAAAVDSLLGIKL